MIRKYRGVTPSVALSAYVDPSAQVIGDVVIGERSSIWPCVVLRGDTEALRVGNETNIQDNTVMHADDGFPCILGDRVTVGHSAVIHGCTVEDDALIGIGAIILNGAKIGKGAVVAAGALIPEGMEVPAETLALGAPARPHRPVREQEKVRFRHACDHYVERGQIYLREAAAQNSTGNKND
jgi:gamma-carbonic anhydrase